MALRMEEASGTNALSYLILGSVMKSMKQEMLKKYFEDKTSNILGYRV